MKLTIVGCTGSMSGPRSPASAYLLQAWGPDGNGGERVWSVLFDLGPGSYGQMWNYLPPAELDGVFLSHLHADHCADLVSLHVFQKWAPCSPGRIMPLMGPAGVRERIGEIDGNTQKNYDHEFACTTMTPQQTVTLGPFTVTAYQAWHPVKALCYRVEGPVGFPAEQVGNARRLGPTPDADTAVFTFTGDTDLRDTVVDAARNCDLLLAEAGFSEPDEPRLEDGSPCRGIHMTGVRTGQLARDAQAKALVATHIQPWTPQETVLEEIARTWQGPTDLAETGKSYLI